MGQVRNKQLIDMSPAVSSMLAEDLQRYVALGRALHTRQEIASVLGIGKRRAERLRAHLLQIGSAAVGVAPPAAPKVERSRPPVHLVIPDSHARPGVSLEHFMLLGKLERHIAPDHTICLGDWYDLPSLFEGKGQTLKQRAQESLALDLEAGRKALQLYHDGAGRTDVKRHFCVGNHDARIYRIGDREPWLSDIVDVVDHHKTYGWEVHEFLEPLRIDGVRYQHYLTQEGTDKAISGRYHAQRMLERLRFFESIIVGHSHRFDYRTESLPDGRRVHAIVAGCCFEHEEDYAGPDDNGAWWRGAIVLRNVHNGDFDLDMWSLDRIRRELG